MAQPSIRAGSPEVPPNHGKLLVGPVLPLRKLGGISSLDALNTPGWVRSGVRGCSHGLIAALPYLLSLSFLVFPVVSSAAFRAFSCEEFADRRAYLRADYQVECSTDTHTSSAHEAAKGLAIAAILLYPVGISMLYVVLMLRARRALLSAKQTALSDALSFLVHDYEPDYFWWELLEAWKKLFLVGFMVLILPGRAAQLIIAFLFSLVYMLTTAIAMPFKDCLLYTSPSPRDS